MSARPDAATAALPQSRDVTNIGQLVREHAGYVWRVLRSLGVHESDLDDVSQEVFITVHRRLSTFEERSTLTTWIYGIAIRVASDYRKRAHRRHEVVTATPPERLAASSQDAALERKEAWALVQRALDALTEDQRHAFVLYEIEGLTIREIAEVLECPLQTIYSRLLVARERVQLEIAAQPRTEGSP